MNKVSEKTSGLAILDKPYKYKSLSDATEP